jgi:hypothetical protein
MQDYSGSDGIDLTIEGPHRGPVRCERLVVREGASLVGDVRASVVKVLGRLDGNIEADQLMVGPTARLMRGVATVANTPVIAPGAVMRNFSMFIGISAVAADEGSLTRPEAASFASAVASMPDGFGGPALGADEHPGFDGDDHEGDDAPVSTGLSKAIEDAVRAEIALLARQTAELEARNAALDDEEAAAMVEAISAEIAEISVAGDEPEDEAPAEAVPQAVAVVVPAPAPTPAPAPAEPPRAERPARTMVLPSLI